MDEDVEGERRRRLLENERQQMELIRELDMEELQIEIVDEDDEEDAGDRPDFMRHHIEGATSYESINFNTCLASLHTYLGEVDDTHGRFVFLDGGAILNLPMFYLEGVILFPEAVLPLKVIQSEFKAAVDKALTQTVAPYTIGVVGVHRNPDTGRVWFRNIGTTAEIRQFKWLNDGSVNVVARGQQRFRMRHRWIDVEGVPCAEVQIIQEDAPLRTPKNAFARLASTTNIQRQCVATSQGPCSNSGAISDEDGWECGYDSSPSSQHAASPSLYEKLTGSPVSKFKTTSGMLNLDFQKHGESHDNSKFTSISRTSNLDFERFGESHDKVERSKGYCKKSKKHTEEFTQKGKKPAGSSYILGCGLSNRVPLSFWPCWVYDMYDSYSLARRASDMWKQIVGTPNLDDFVNQPDTLSFYIASRMPLSQSTRQELLEIDGVSYRLKREIQLLERFNLIRCRSCRTVIAKRSDMLVMSADGPLNAYVNPYGFVHEIITLYNANGLVLHGDPVKEHSWFPGYSWTVTGCSVCDSTMGWLFRATNKRLRPYQFWGIRASQVADDTSQS